jgi:hypothetical protein
VLFIANTQAKQNCKRVKTVSYLKRLSRKVSYKKTVVAKRNVRVKRRVCYNQRYKYTYYQKYRTRVPRTYTVRVPYQEKYTVTVKRPFKCRKRVKKFRLVTKVVTEKRKCIKKRKAYKWKTRRVPYPSTCSRKVKVKRRKRVLRPYITKCPKRVPYYVTVTRKYRCTKVVTRTRWTGKWDKTAPNCYKKVMEKYKVRVNRWCFRKVKVQRTKVVYVRCTKYRHVYITVEVIVVRKYKCTKYRVVRYKSWYLKPYVSTCLYKKKIAVRVPYWYYYNTTCWRLVKVTRTRTRFRLVRRTRLVWVIKTRKVYQYRWRAATKVVPAVTVVYYTKQVTAYRTEYYYQRFWKYKLVCVTVTKYRN